MSRKTRPDILPGSAVHHSEAYRLPKEWGMRRRPFTILSAPAKRAAHTANTASAVPSATQGCSTARCAGQGRAMGQGKRRREARRAPGSYPARAAGHTSAPAARAERQSAKQDCDFFYEPHMARRCERRGRAATGSVSQGTALGPRCSSRCWGAGRPGAWSRAFPAWPC